MSLKREFKDTLLIALGSVATGFLYIVIVPQGPQWLYWVIFLIAWIVYSNVAEKKKREEKEHEENLAMIMHEAEVKLRIKAEQENR
jgi:hypothetical protein